MFQIKWIKEAIEEQVAIFEYWNQRNQSTAYSRKIYTNLKKAETRLKKNPLIGADTNYKGVKRILVLKRFSLFYKINDKVVYILALWDNSRNPDSLNL